MEFTCDEGALFSFLRGLDLEPRDIASMFLQIGEFKVCDWDEMSLHIERDNSSKVFTVRM